MRTGRGRRGRRAVRRRARRLQPARRRRGRVPRPHLGLGRRLRHRLWQQGRADRPATCGDRGRPAADHGRDRVAHLVRHRPPQRRAGRPSGARRDPPRRRVAPACAGRSRRRPARHGRRRQPLRRSVRRRGRRRWVGVHFGSRGFGHKTATQFLALAGEHQGGMDAAPSCCRRRALGQEYIAAMQLAGEYAYAGRDVVVARVLDILGASEISVCTATTTSASPATRPFPRPGSKPMENVRVGDVVYALNPDVGLEETRVIDHWSAGVQDTYTISMGVRRIVCTGSHPLLVIDDGLRWRRAEEISPGQVSCAPRATTARPETGAWARLVSWARSLEMAGSATIPIARATARTCHRQRVRGTHAPLSRKARRDLSSEPRFGGPVGRSTPVVTTGCLLVEECVESGP